MMGLSPARLLAARIEFPAKGGVTALLPQQSSQPHPATLRFGDPVTLSTRPSRFRATQGLIGNGNDNISSADTASGFKMKRSW